MGDVIFLFVLFFHCVCDNQVIKCSPDLELRRGPGFYLLALLAFLPSVISSCFTQNKEGGGDPGPSPRSTTEVCSSFAWQSSRFENFQFLRSLALCMTV